MIPSSVKLFGVVAASKVSGASGEVSLDADFCRVSTSSDGSWDSVIGLADAYVLPRAFVFLLFVVDILKCLELDMTKG